MKNRATAIGQIALVGRKYAESRNEKQSNSLVQLHGRFIELINSLICELRLSITVRRERKALSLMTESQLRDIGIHRSFAEAEYRRGVFDIPRHRIDDQQH